MCALVFVCLLFEIEITSSKNQGKIQAKFVEMMSKLQNMGIFMAFVLAFIDFTEGVELFGNFI